MSDIENLDLNTKTNEEIEIEIDSEEFEEEFIDIKIIEKELTTYCYISNHLCFEYFIGYEITALLGYKNPSKTVNDYVSKCNQLIFRDYPGIKEPNLNPKVVLITRDGVVEILLKTRKRLSQDVLHLLKEFKIDITNRKCLTKEQQTLSAITNAFKMEKFEDQYKVGCYYLDLYFIDHKIVIECDENGHADRKPYNERKRMDYVNTTFNIDDSHWVRYNPDEHDFDISKVIGKIYTLINTKNKQKYDDLLFKIKNMNLESAVKLNILTDKSEIDTQKLVHKNPTIKPSAIGNVLSSQQNKKMHKCENCNYKTPYKTHLSRHLNKQKKCSSTTYVANPEKEVVSVYVEKPLTTIQKASTSVCKHCNEVFDNSDSLTKHIKKLKCIVLYKHLKLTCKFCNRVFSRSDCLKKHIDLFRCKKYTQSKTHIKQKSINYEELERNQIEALSKIVYEMKSKLTHIENTRF